MMRILSKSKSLLMITLCALSLNACSGMGFGISLDKIFGAQSFAEKDVLEEEDENNTPNDTANTNPDDVMAETQAWFGEWDAEVEGVSFDGEINIAEGGFENDTTANDTVDISINGFEENVPSSDPVEIAGNSPTEIIQPSVDTGGGGEENFLPSESNEITVSTIGATEINIPDTQQAEATIAMIGGNEPLEIPLSDAGNTEEQININSLAETSLLPEQKSIGGALGGESNEAPVKKESEGGLEYGGEDQVLAIPVTFPKITDGQGIGVTDTSKIIPVCEPQDVGIYRVILNFKKDAKSGLGATGSFVQVCTRYDETNANTGLVVVKYGWLGINSDVAAKLFIAFYHYNDDADVETTELITNISSNSSFTLSDDMTTKILQILKNSSNVAEFVVALLHDKDSGRYVPGSKILLIKNPINTAPDESVLDYISGKMEAIPELPPAESEDGTEDAVDETPPADQGPIKETPGPIIPDDGEVDDEPTDPLENCTPSQLDAIKTSQGRIDFYNALIKKTTDLKLVASYKQKIKYYEEEIEKIITECDASTESDTGGDSQYPVK